MAPFAQRQQRRSEALARRSPESARLNVALRIVVTLVSSSVLALLVAALGDPGGVVLGAFLIAISIGGLVAFGKTPACVLLLLALVQNFGIGILAHIVSAKPLAVELYRPQSSYMIAGVYSVVAAVIVCALPRADRSALPEPKSLKQAEVLSALTFGWGFTCTCIVVIVGFAFHGSLEADTGGLGTFFKHSIFLAVPAVLFVIDRENRRSVIIRGAAFVALGTSLVLALVLSQRKIGFDILVAILLGYWAGRGRVTARSAGLAAAGAVIFFGFVSPVISQMRFDVANVPLEDRPAFVLNRMPTYIGYIFGGREENRAVEGALAAKYLDYVGRGPVVQRLAGVQILDIAVASNNRSGGGAHDPLKFGWRQVLPSALSRDKVSYSLSDVFTWDLGLRPFGTIGHPFVSLLASSVWGYGVVNGVLLSLALITLIAMLLNIATPRLHMSVWGALMLVALYNPVAEGNIAAYLEVIVRRIPELVLVMLVFGSLARGIANKPDTGASGQPRLWRQGDHQVRMTAPKRIGV